MTAPAPTPAETTTARDNAREITRRAYARLYKQALDAGDRDAAERYRKAMDGLEKKWRSE